MSKVDIRLDVSFLGHRKRKRLLNKLGPQGVLSLIDLWLSCRQNKPKGILKGMDEEDIALDAQYPGDPIEFCKTLFETGWLEQLDGNGKDWQQGLTYAIHDWEDHQSFAFYSIERSEKAKKAAQKRWADADKNDERITDACATDKGLMHNAYNGHTKRNAPTPTPTPTPTPLNLIAPPFDIFWKAYPKKRAKANAEKAWMKINPNEQLLATILEKIELAKTSEEWKEKGGKFIPHPASWLNARGWEDEPTIVLDSRKGDETKIKQQQEKDDAIKQEEEKIRAEFMALTEEEQRPYMDQARVQLPDNIRYSDLILVETAITLFAQDKQRVTQQQEGAQ